MLLLPSHAKHALRDEQHDRESESGERDQQTDLHSVVRHHQQADDDQCRDPQQWADEVEQRLAAIRAEMDVRRSWPVWRRMSWVFSRSI